jgi:PRTRC genetic system protein B
MFFSDRGGDRALKTMNGKRYPQPPLLFKASGSHLWIRALGRKQRPTASSKLYLAPYWNCYANGICCNGTMALPQEKSVTAIDAWEKSFFQSEFTHAAGGRKPTRFAGGILAMWASLDGKKKFPTRYLVETKQTLNQFITNHDSSYRNEQ